MRKTIVHVSKSRASFSCFCRFFIFTPSLLPSLIFSISTKAREVVVAIEIWLGFVLDTGEIDKTDLRLKIEVFAAAHLCFSKAFFSRFFLYCFIRVFFVNQKEFFSFTKNVSFQSKTLLYLCTAINNVLSCLHVC